MRRVAGAAFCISLTSPLAFKLHALILLNMFNSVQTGQVTAPLWEAAKMQVPPGTDNRAFLREYVVNLLASGFKNLTPYASLSFL